MIAAVNFCLLGADHARLPGARRGRPLRLHAVAGRTRARRPVRDPGSPLPRWSSAENLALEDMSFFTDHQVGDTRPPWLPPQAARLPRAGGQRSIRAPTTAAATRPRRRTGRSTTPRWRPPTCSRATLAVLAADADAPDLGADRRADACCSRSCSRASSRPGARGWRCSRRCSSPTSRCTGSSRARSTTTSASTPPRRRSSCC